MVMQPTSYFFVGGSNPGRANTAAAPPMTADRQGFEPLTEKSAAGLRYHSTVACCDSHLHPHCLEPSDHKYHALGYATRMTPQKGGIRRPRLRLI